MSKVNVLLIGQISGSQTGGFSGNEPNAPTYLQTLAPTYLRNHFFGTFCAEPVFFLQLATELRRAGLSVRILDGLLGNNNKKTLEEELMRFEADIYAFSIFHSSYFSVIEIMKTIKRKNPNAIVVTGGTYASIVYKQLLERHAEINYIVVGDGDEALPELCNNIIYKNHVSQIAGVACRKNGEVFLCQPKPVDINKVGQLARDFGKEIIDNGFSFSMVSSRGCGYGVCSFCYLSPYQRISNHPKFRGRSPELMVKEIKELQEKYSIDRITFVDEDFFGPLKEGTERAVNFAKLLLKENIKINYYVNGRINSVLYLIKNDYLKILSDSGLKYLFIGIESGSDKVLKKYKKGITVEQIKEVAKTLDSHGIKINPGIITFDPELTMEDVKANIDIIKEIGYYDIFVFTRKLVVLPGTQVGDSVYNWDLPDSRYPFQQSSITPEDYFKDAKTTLLYHGLVQFRNLLYPIYYDFTSKFKYINPLHRERLIKNHYLFFEGLYNNTASDKILNLEDIERFVKQGIEKTTKIVAEINSLQ